MCTLLVTQTVACLVTGCQLAWFLIYSLLVTQTLACLVYDSELAWYLVCTLVVILTVAVLFKVVSWPSF